MVKRQWKSFLLLALLAVIALAQQPIQLQTDSANTTLGASSNYGTGPGTVKVLGVNAFVTNTVTVTGSGGTFPTTGTTNLLPQSTSTYALTDFDLAATAATQVKGSAGNVWGFYGFNPNASTCFLQFYNSTSATLGTNPLHPFGVLAGASFVYTSPIALANYSTGISTGETTTATGGTGCSSAMVITILYN